MTCGELTMNDHQHSKLWKGLRPRKGQSRLLRYGGAVGLPILAGLVVFRWPMLADDPFFIFLGAVALSAANGGLAAAFVTIALSALIIRLLFVGDLLTLHYNGNLEGIAQMAGFALLAMLVSSVIAGLRRERNDLRESEERYRILAEAASDAIIVTDEKGSIMYANPVSEKIFGAKPRQLVGQNLESLLPGPDYHARLTELRHHLDTRKQPVAVKLPGRHSSGRHILVEMTLGTSCHRGVSVFTAIFREISGNARQAA